MIGPKVARQPASAACRGIAVLRLGVGDQEPLDAAGSAGRLVHVDHRRRQADIVLGHLERGRSGVEEAVEDLSRLMPMTDS